MGKMTWKDKFKEGLKKFGDVALDVTISFLADTLVASLKRWKEKRQANGNG